MKKLAVGIIAFFCISAQAGYTTDGKTIKVIVPTGPASGIANLYRQLETYAAKNQITMVPVFKPGAASKIGMQYAATSTDTSGDTLLLSLISDISEHSYLPQLQAVTAVTGINLVLLASKKSGIRTTKDIALIEKSSPGSLNWAVINSLHSNRTYAIADSWGLARDKITSIQYSSDMQNHIISGDLDLGWFSKPTAESLNSAGLANIVELDSQTIKNLERKKNGTAIFMPKGANSDAIKFWEEFVIKFHKDEAVIEFKKKDGSLDPSPGVDNLINYVNNWSK